MLIVFLFNKLLYFKLVNNHRIFQTMKDLHSILKEITELTTTIETQYPELYQFLGEDPLTIGADEHPEIDKKVMKDYLGSLQQVLKHYLESHKSVT